MFRSNRARDMNMCACCVQLNYTKLLFRGQGEKVEEKMMNENV